MLKVTSEGQEIDYGSFFETACVAVQPGLLNVVLEPPVNTQQRFLRQIAGLQDGQAAVPKGALSYLDNTLGLFPDLSVFQNILEPLRTRPGDRTAKHDQVSQCLEAFGLSDVGQTKLRHLPEETLCRAELARAWVRPGGVIVLDNTLAHLPYDAQFDLFGLLHALIRGDARTLIIGSSNAALSLRFADHLMIEAEGRIIQSGPPQALRNAPDSLAAAQAMAECPLNMATVVKTGPIMRMRSGLSWEVKGRQAFIPEGIYMASLSPYDVLPQEFPDFGAQLRIRVVGSELTHSESRARFRLEGQPWSSRFRGHFRYTVSEMQDFWLDTDKCQYFAQSGRLFVG